MKINRVKLTNYRVHKDLEVDFTRGINLLLGKNGSGKSSILEAIGFAMFDSSLRSNVKDAVRRGEKYGNILVEFVGNDGIEYIVEKKIGKNGHILYKKDNKLEKMDKKDEIIKEIKKLSGIQENSKKIYESVITASQNKIVDIFTAKDKERERDFNEIFDTKIYNNMYYGFIKEAKDTYEDKLKMNNGKLEGLKEGLDNGEEIKKELKMNKKELKEKDELKKGLEKELKEKENKKAEIEIIKNDLEKIKKDIKNEEEKGNKIQNDLDERKRTLKSAEKSRIIIEKNEKNYNDYISLKEKVAEYEEKIKILRDKKEKIIELKEEKGEKEKSIILLKNDIKNCEEKRDLKEADIKEKLKEIEIKKEELEKEKELEGKLDEELKEISKKLKVLTEKIQLRNGFELNLRDYKKEIDEFNKKIFNEEKENLGMLKLEEELLEISREKDIKKKIENEIVKYDALLDQNEKAKKEFSGGNCPILNQECKNILESGKNIETYFEENKRKLEELKKQEEEKIRKYDKLEEKEILIREKISNIKSLIKNYNNEKEKIGQKEIEIKLIKKDLKINELEILEILEKNKIENKDGKLDFQLELDKLKEKLTIKSTEIKALDIMKTQKELEIIEEKQKENIRQKDEFIIKLKNTNEDLTKEKIQKDEFEEKIKEIKMETNGYEELNNKYEELKKQKESLEEFYQKYIENLIESQRVEELKEKIDNQKSELKKIEKEILKLNEKNEKLKEKYTEEKYINIKKELDILKEKTSEILGEIGILSQKVDTKKGELEKYKLKEKEIKKMKKEIKRYEEKLKMTESFRAKISYMGKEVADYMLKEIEIKATENFREITGRSEEVTWVNNKKESYAVYLKESDKKINFEMLSGGEQVAVALSIRAALASTLSKASFSIFDEPTNNLDEERRKSLADSLNIVLKGIEQSIIVTHDDTFKEMAENIVLL